MDQTDEHFEDKQRQEITYYHNQVNELSASLIKMQYRNTQMSNEIKQMRSAMSLISGLKGVNAGEQSLSQIYEHFTEEILKLMQMDLALVLQRNGSGHFQPTHCKGYTNEEEEMLLKLIFDESWNEILNKHSMLVNSQTQETEAIIKIRQELLTPFFILSPVLVDEQPYAYLLAARKTELRSQASMPLMLHDQNALEAIAGIVSALINQIEQNTVLDRKVAIRTHQLNVEKRKSDELLLNILPHEVADELKKYGKAEAKQMDNVTVIFTDFKGFTELSQALSPQLLVAEINECFSAFDHIMNKYGIEKIKTIGDSYMAAGGLPITNYTHAVDVVSAALEINEYMILHKQERSKFGKPFFEIRIGIHTGPVVAGIVGVKKFAYDIWGDTVNTANRMESNGTIGKVNISKTTFESIKHVFNCSYRGKIIAKGKGELEMYYVDGRISD